MKNGNPAAGVVVGMDDGGFVPNLNPPWVVLEVEGVDDANGFADATATFDC